MAVADLSPAPAEPEHSRELAAALASPSFIRAMAGLAAASRVSVRVLGPSREPLWPTGGPQCVLAEGIRRCDGLAGPGDGDCAIEEIALDDGRRCPGYVVCCGPATRAGCGAQCPKVNIPCTGCDGPGPLVSDQGAAAISALASIITDPEVIQQTVDPVGTFYKYSLAHSTLRRKVQQ